MSSGVPSIGGRSSTGISTPSSSRSFGKSARSGTHRSSPLETITPDAFARWDAAEDWQIGKQGYRFDAVSIVIGIGRAATAREDEGALIDAGTNEFVEHLVRQGAIEDTEEEREGASQRERGTTVRVMAVLTQNTPRSC